MNFCSNCGAPVSHRTPPGDDRPRYVCDMCAVIYYQNPKIVAGCVPQWEDRVLLCRRAIEPRAGLWTLPAGFMENGETTTEAAARETLEEANAKVDVGQLFCYLNIPRISQVQIIYRATLRTGDFAPGPESLEVALFDWPDLPWQDFAFPSVHWAVTHYKEVVGEAAFQPHTNPPGDLGDY